MYNDWHDGGLYDGATQAQGMTLADLIWERPQHYTYLESLCVYPAVNPYNLTTPAGNYTYRSSLAESPIELSNTTDTPWTFVSKSKTLEGLTGGVMIDTYHENFRVERGDGGTVYVYWSDDRDPGSPAWPNYGLEYVDLPPNTPLCAALWDRVSRRFNERYYKRYLSGETLDEWQRLLQVRTDEVVPRIERAMRIYAANDIDADLVASQVTEYLDLKDTGTSGSSGKNSGKTTVTPDQSINESDSYAGQTSSSSSESSGTTSNTRTGKVRTTQTALGGIIPQLNLSIEEWLDLETLLIERYSSCFMSFIWS